MIFFKKNLFKKIKDFIMTPIQYIFRQILSETREKKNETKQPTNKETTTNNNNLYLF